MDNAQLAALCTAIVTAGGTIAGVLRWAVGRVVLALDNNTAAYVKNVESLAVFGTKLDQVLDWQQEHTPPPVDIERLRAREDKTPVETPRGAYGPMRPRTVR